MPTCFKCKTFLPNIPNLKIHLNSIHKKDCFIFYTCAEDNCFANFKTWAQLREHLNRCHRAVPTVKEFRVDETENDFPSDDENLFIDSSNNADEELLPDPVVIAKDVKQEMCDLLLEITGKLYADPTLPRCHVQVMVDEMHGLISKVISIVKPTIVTTMQSVNIEQENIRKVAACLILLIVPLILFLPISLD